MKRIIYTIILSLLSIASIAQDKEKSGIYVSGQEVQNFISTGDSGGIFIQETSDTAAAVDLANTEQSETATYTVETVPNVKLTTNSYVSDPNHFLQSATVDQINSMLGALEQKTTDQVAVVILNSIDFEVPKDFAYKLFNHWGIGIKGKDNGLLILMIMDQRRVEFETGYGMESMLPDAICKRIQMNYMVPQFKAGNYDQGILEGVKATVDILSNPENSKIAAELKANIASEAQQERLALIVTIGSFYLLFILIFFINKKRKKSFRKIGATTSADISQAKWLVIYLLLPVLFSLYMYSFYTGDHFILSFFLGCYFIAMLFLAEKRIRINQSLAQKEVEGDYYENYKRYKASHSSWWIAALFFPLVFVFYMIFYEFKKRAMRNHPRNCKHCSHELHKLSETEDDEYLSKTQLLEENLKSIDYDVWLCKNCEAKEVYNFVNYSSKYTNCSKCGVKAFYLYSDKTIVSATYSSSGTGCKTYLCKNCHYQKESSYTIAMKEASSSSSSSGSGGSSGGSWSGGSSGGGGSGSSW